MRPKKEVIVVARTPEQWTELNDQIQVVERMRDDANEKLASAQAQTMLAREQLDGAEQLESLLVRELTASDHLLQNLRAERHAELIPGSSS